MNERLTNDQKHEQDLKRMAESVDERTAMYHGAVARGEAMFRRSEAMRNRQIDIINRLSKEDSTVTGELVAVLQENVRLREEAYEMSALVQKLGEEVKELRAQLDTTGGNQV